MQYRLYDKDKRLICVLEFAGDLPLLAQCNPDAQYIKYTAEDGHAYYGVRRLKTFSVGRENRIHPRPKAVSKLWTWFAVKSKATGYWEIRRYSKRNYEQATVSEDVADIKGPWEVGTKTEAKRRLQDDLD